MKIENPLKSNKLIKRCTKTKWINSFENANLHPSLIEECINKISIGFMFAPSHHSAMKYAIGPRKEIGLKTIFFRFSID